MFRVIVTILIIYFFLGCHTNADHTREDIVVACIKDMIGSGDSAKMAYRFSRETPAIMPDSERIVLEKQYDSIKKILDTATVFIVLSDTLSAPSTEEKADIDFGRKEMALQHLDASFVNWNDTKKQIINTKFIAGQLNIPVQKNLPPDLNNIRLIASFHFSTIVFDNTQKKATVYTQYSCGGKCGYDALMILKKENDSWLVIDKIKTNIY